MIPANSKRFRSLARELIEASEQLCDATLGAPEATSQEAARKGAVSKDRLPDAEARSRPQGPEDPWPQGAALGPIEDDNHPRDLIKAPKDVLGRIEMAQAGTSPESTARFYGWVTGS